MEVEPSTGQMQRYDVTVIGPGAGEGVPAYGLAAPGRSVLLLEHFG